MPIFKRLDVHAFFRIRTPFSLPLDKQGLILVEGENRDGGGAVDSNGAMKSASIIETLTWGIFERMIRHGNKAIGDLVLNERQNKAHVAVAVDDFVIDRARPGRLTVTTEHTAPGLSRDPIRRQDEVTRLVQMSYDAWRYSAVVQAAEALADGGFAQQMAVVESLLQLDQLSRAAELGRAEANQLSKTVAAKRAERDGFQYTLDEVERVLAGLQAPSLDATERASLLARITAAEEASARLEPLQQVVENTERIIELARRRSIEENANLVSPVKEKARLESRLNSLACSECGRPFGNEDETRAAQATAQGKIDALTEEINGIFKKKAAADQEVGTLGLRLHGQREELRNQERLAGQLEDLQRQLALLDQREAERAEQLAQVEDSVARTRAQLTSAEEALAAASVPLFRKSFWAKDFGRDELQASIFSNGLPVLNRAAEEYSLALTGGLFQVQFAVARDSRAEDMIRVSGEAAASTYAGLSRGEKERTNLIVAMSLRALARWRLGVPLNLTVYDEVFDHVDPAGLRIAANLLAEEASGGNTVIVITHNPTLKALFPGAKLIRVVREGGEASVYYS